MDLDIFSVYCELVGTATSYRRATHHVLNAMLDFSAPMFETCLSIFFAGKFFHAHAFPKPSTLTEHLFHR